MSARTKTNVSQSLKVPSAEVHPSLKRAMNLIRKGDYAGAADLLRSGGRDERSRNTLGVCLMRSGEIEDAVKVFRQFVLIPGTVIERADVSKLCKRNYAVALLLKGFPSGALAVLTELREPDHPTARRIRAAIASWEKSLSWLRWIDWKLNLIEPPHCQVPIDFVPGELDFEIAPAQPRTLAERTSDVAANGTAVGCGAPSS